MHTYEHITPAGQMPDESSTFDAHPFLGPLDVVEWARIHRTVGAQSWPEVWHLDDDGLLCCGTICSTGESITRWAEDPSALRRSRDEGVRTGGCPARWLIVESRATHRREGPTIDEGDAQAFLRLRPQMELMGITLLDVMVFDNQCHWWSLQELTSGSTAWAPPPLRQAS